MSITFFLKNHQTEVNYDNPAYNPTEPEDPIYNPRHISEPIYPQLNMSNSNAMIFLEFLGLTPDYVGTIKYEDLDDFCWKLTDLQTKSIRENYNPRTIGYMKHLEKIVRYAMALKDDVVWC